MMTSQDELDILDVRLTDPRDIEAKLPKAHALLEAKRRFLIDARRDLENWKLLVERLEAMSGGDNKESPPNAQTSLRSDHARAPAQEAIVEALEIAGEPLKPAALYRLMVERGMNAKNANAVGAATWQAWKAKRIKKLADGRYAPLTFVPADLLSSSESPGGP